MADQYRKPYLDSSVFIDWIKGEVRGEVNRGEIAAHILSLAERGEFDIYTSAITLAEVHKLRGGPIIDPHLSNRILEYFEHPFVQIVDVDRAVGEQANAFCRQYAIYPNDAIHLACSLRAGCDVLLAWDRLVTSVQHPGIRIEEPQIIGQMVLPDLAVIKPPLH